MGVERDHWHQLGLKTSKDNLKCFCRTRACDLAEDFAPILMPLTRKGFALDDSFSFSNEMVRFDANNVIFPLTIRFG